jgi:hypothetical protein
MGCSRAGIKDGFGGGVGVEQDLTTGIPDYLVEGVFFQLLFVSIHREKRIEVLLLLVLFLLRWRR